jgi:hypothetical protein
LQKQTDPSTIQNLQFTNLSSKPLLEYKSILGLGEKFIPDPVPLSLFEIQKEYFKFERNIKLCDYFKDKESTDYNPKLKIPSTWTPPDSSISDRTLASLTYIKNNIMDKFIDITHKNNKKSKLLQQLMNLKDIKIVQSDKNLGLVALDTIDYHQKVMLNLNDTNHYTPADSTKLFEHVSLKYQLLLQSAGFTKSELNYLKHPWQFTLPNFHILPKLHKKNDLKGRPIVGATNWFTTPPSILLDTLLQSESFPSHILKNSESLILHTKNIVIPENSILVTMDVSALYTNIDTQILSNLLGSNKKKQMLLEFICECNYFQYADKIYRQTNGIAMGTNSAVNLANLYLLKLLDPLILNNPEITYYARFIDDLFFIFPNNLSLLNDFHLKLNNIIPDIKLTMEYSSTNINYLDLNIHLQNSSLEFKIYQKPMNQFLYLPAHSTHPKSTKQSFITGEILRFKRLTTNNFDFMSQCRIFRYHLLRRGYSNSFLDPLFSKIPESKERNSSTRNIQLILRYTNTIQTPIRTFIFQNQRHFDYLNINIRTTYRNSMSIGKTILKSNLSSKQLEFLKEMGHC